MRPIKMLLAISLAAAGLAASVDVQAQKHGWRGGGHHHHGHWRGHGHWHGPRLGFWLGAPLAIGLGTHWWGHPWYDEPRVVFREVIREPEVIETVREVPAPSLAEAQRGPDAPSQGPLYMNYCASSRAYFPKVQSCPEGWKFIAPNQ